MTPGKKHHPTPESRQLVINYLSCGRTQEAAARALDISVDSLDRHYRYEIDTATDFRVAQLGDTAFKKALDGDTTMLIFLLKTMGKFRTEDSKVQEKNNEEAQKIVDDFIKKHEQLYKKEY